LSTSKPGHIYPQYTIIIHHEIAHTQEEEAYKMLTLHKELLVYLKTQTQQSNLSQEMICLQHRSQEGMEVFYKDTLLEGTDYNKDLDAHNSQFYLDLLLRRNKELHGTRTRHNLLEQPFFSKLV
jgi:hypothetical protein